MTADIRITNVHDNRVRGGWTIRGERLDQSHETFRAEAANRDVTAMCLGARVIGWPVRVETNAAGNIVKVTVI